MVVYGIYGLEALEKLIDTVLGMHNTTVPNGKLFAGKLGSWHIWYLTED